MRSLLSMATRTLTAVYSCEFRFRDSAQSAAIDAFNAFARPSGQARGPSQIAATRAREAAKAARARAEAQALLVANKALGKASKVAAESDDAGMAQALEASRAALAEQAAAMGLRVPEARAARAEASA